MILKISDIEAKATERPAGYVENVLQRARAIDSETVELSDKDYRELCEGYQHGPSVLELVSNFTGALTRWVAAGAPTVTKEQYHQRLSICKACPHWNGNKCVKCGCYRLKHWLATEKCPDTPSKWPSL